MTQSEYLDALRAAALAGDLKAKAFLRLYEAGFVTTPMLPALPPEPV